MICAVWNLKTRVQLMAATEKYLKAEECLQMFALNTTFCHREVKPPLPQASAAARKAAVEACCHARTLVTEGGLTQTEMMAHWHEQLKS
jgi:hypothetical protein